MKWRGKEIGWGCVGWGMEVGGVAYMAGTIFPPEAHKI